MTGNWPSLRVLDLFAGLEGWSAPWRERGHEVYSVDIEERFDVDSHADVLTLTPDDLPWRPDVILASPPCEKFSVLAIGKAWLPGYVPKHAGTVLAMDLVKATANLIEQLQPSFWIVENPVGMLRKLHLLPYERQTVTYCQYGAPWRKPTDLWGGFPPSLVLKPMCRNGQPCHLAAPRGSRTAIQSDTGLENKHPLVRRWYETVARQPSTMGKNGHTNVSKAFGGGDRAAMRAVIPPELSLSVCLAAERDAGLALVAGDYTGRLFT